MNTIATFENTVGILVKAYLDGTLLKGNCHACAVGNLCASALGAQVIDIKRESSASECGHAKWSNGVIPEWSELFVTDLEGKQAKRWLYPTHSPHRSAIAYEHAAATGYSVEQLAKIEFAFEAAGEGYTEEAEFAGLMAVVDVLAEIHGIDLSTATAAKELFVRA